MFRPTLLVLVKFRESDQSVSLQRTIYSMTTGQTVWYNIVKALEQQFDKTRLSDEACEVAENLSSYREAGLHRTLQSFQDLRPLHFTLRQF